MNRGSFASPALRLLLPLIALALATGTASLHGQAPAAEPADAPAERADSISARGALLRSLVLPGWGQSYVGAPGRGAIYFALEAGSLWMAYKTSAKLDQARDLQRYYRETGRLTEDQTLGLVDTREEQLEDWLALSIFMVLFSGADAYVAAQLADFDDVIGVRPGADGGLQLEARVPMGRR